MHFFMLLSWAICTLAGPLAPRQAGPSVTISNGTVVGSSDGSIDSFKGIPFADPPTNTNRLRAPSPVATSFGTIQAIGQPTACPQFYTQVDTSNLPSEVIGVLLDTPFGQEIQMEGEDCLNLNVQRPAGTTADSNLPVIVWIYGGGFEFGSTQGYDGSSLIERSVALGQPVIYVAINYRVGGFGFLAGSELQNEGNTNLGLKDQRLGLQWIQENSILRPFDRHSLCLWLIIRVVAAFGGDPSKVTLWVRMSGLSRHVMN